MDIKVRFKRKNSNRLRDNSGSFLLSVGKFRYDWRVFDPHYSAPRDDQLIGLGSVISEQITDWMRIIGNRNITESDIPPSKIKILQRGGVFKVADIYCRNNASLYSIQGIGRTTIIKMRQFVDDSFDHVINQPTRGSNHE